MKAQELKSGSPLAGTSSIKIGICGLGTVGAGTLKLIQNNQAELVRRLGQKLEISHVASRTPKPELTTSIKKVSDDVFDIVNDPEIDIVVETIGGFEPALELVLQAIARGKHVVTANKALIAVHGNEIFASAREHGVMVSYESSVAGGIPIIKALREGLAANRIEWLAGIINGTGNYILTEMAARQRQFDDVLLEAQKLGYAEADPGFDVEGIDAAHKLTIMASIAFGIPLQFDKTYTEGISKITPEDIRYARELGYTIKHLGIARKQENGVELRVHPTLIHQNKLIANVNGVLNAVVVKGHAVGTTMYAGAGAGAEATASSVVADVLDIGRIMQSQEQSPLPPALAFGKLNKDLTVLGIEQITTEYYLRISALDKLGVMAKISGILLNCDISIEAVIQKEAVSEIVPIVFLTHEILEAKLNNAITAIEMLPEVVAPVMRIRVENFGNEESL